MLLATAIQKYCSLVLLQQFHGAQLVLLWCFMLFLYTAFLNEYNATLLYQWDMDNPVLMQSALHIQYMMWPVFPLVGMVADVWTGRYRIIVVSIYSCFIGWLLSAVSYFTVAIPTVSATFLVIGIAFQIIGIAGSQSVLVPFIIDQAIGASADELSSMIHWILLSYPSGLWMLNVLKCFTNNWSLLGGICLTVSGVSIVVLMSSYYLFRHKLDTTPHITNPIKLIFKVLNYARKTKYPENRSALTYYLDEAPSRLDLGKEKYGGPFEEEQVEDVKTVFRLLPLLVCIIAYAQVEFVHYVAYLAGIDKNLDHYGAKQKLYLECFIDNKGLFNCTTFFFLLILKLIIQPCFDKYLPSMLKRIQISFGISLLSILMYLAIDLAVSLKGTDNSCWLNTTLHNDHHNATGIDYHWVMVPEIFSGIGFGLSWLVSLEFTLAQSPGHMRGLMVGIFYGIAGITLTFSATLNYPFGYINSNSQPLTCTFFYHVTKSVVMFLIILLFSVLARRYKLRVREEVVDIHKIVSDTYTRYLSQSQTDESPYICTCTSYTYQSVHQTL